MSSSATPRHFEQGRTVLPYGKASTNRKISWPGASSLTRPKISSAGAREKNKELGLAEIQTKAFDSVLEMYFVGDKVSAHWGHYYIEEAFPCQDCKQKNESEYVKAWIEIQDRRIKAVLTYNPETGQPEKEPPPSKEIVGHEAAMTSFKDWQAEQLKDPEFVTALNELEVGYQVAKLRIRRGLTQAQLAEMSSV